MLRAQPAQPGVFAAGQMCGHRTRDGETSCWAEPAWGCPGPAKATPSSPAREVQAEGKELKLLLSNDPEKSS